VVVVLQQRFFAEVVPRAQLSHLGALIAAEEGGEGVA
jgi:hypothetical protein